MSLTVLNLPPEALKKYRPLEAIRRRKAEMSAELSKCRRLAKVAAFKAAKLLKSEFGATEVILFGSLARRGDFTLFSDIDLAVRGIPSDSFYAAVDAILGLNVGFKIDLAELETVPPALLKNIEKDGKSL